MALTTYLLRFRLLPASNPYSFAVAQDSTLKGIDFPNGLMLCISTPFNFGVYYFSSLTSWVVSSANGLLFLFRSLQQFFTILSISIVIRVLLHGILSNISTAGLTLVSSTGLVQLAAKHRSPRPSSREPMERGNIL